MTALRRFARSSPLLSFLFLTLALSWAPSAFGAGLNPFGPLLAAAACSWLGGGGAALRDWWRQTTRWKGSPRWYLLALAVPFAVNATAATLAVLLGAPFPSPEAIGQWPSLLVVFPLYLVAFGPLGEEPGWRGYLLPRLQAGRSNLAASAILGSIVALWHLPLVLAGRVAVVVLPAIFAAQIFYTWLGNKVEGRVLIAMLAHAAQGGLGGEYFGPMFTGPAATLETGLLVAVQCVVTALVVWACGSALGERPDRKSEALSAAAVAA